MWTELGREDPKFSHLLWPRQTEVVGHLLRTPAFLTWKFMEAKLTLVFWASSSCEEPDWVWEGKYCSVSCF